MEPINYGVNRYVLLKYKKGIHNHLRFVSLNSTSNFQYFSP